MQTKELGDRIIKEIGLFSGDNVLHILKEKTMLSTLLVKTIRKKGTVNILNINNKNLKADSENLKFYEKVEDFSLDTDSLDLILFEDTFSELENTREGIQSLKKYLTQKGKIAILEPKDNPILKFLNLGKRKQIDETMFVSGYRLKNQFNFTNDHCLLVYEKE